MKSVIKVGFARGVLEIREFFREKDAVIFTGALPAVMLILFAAIFHFKAPGTNVPAAQIYTTGLMAGGVASTSFVSMAVAIAVERDTGGLKRLAGTPMPRSAYFIGKVVRVVVVSVIEIALLLLIGVLFYHVKLPRTAALWWTLIWVTLLGSAVMGVLGVAISSLPRSSRSAPAVVNLPFIVLEFLSGIFIPFFMLSKGIQHFALLLPLAQLAEGYRSALLPATFAHLEVGGHWNHLAVLENLLAWLVIGFAASLFSFSWGTEHSRGKFPRLRSHERISQVN